MGEVAMGVVNMVFIVLFFETDDKRSESEATRCETRDQESRKIAEKPAWDRD